MKRPQTVHYMGLRVALIDNEMDLYVGLKSRFDEDYEQTTSLPQAGQTFYRCHN